MEQASVFAFDCMYITESIHEGVVEPSYKKYTRSYDTRSAHSRKKRGKSALSHTYSAMSERAGKHRKNI